MKTKTKFFTKRCHIFLMLTWFFGIIYTVFGTQSTKVIEIEIQDQTENGQVFNRTIRECKPNTDDESIDKIYVWVNYIMTFLIPVIILSFTYKSLTNHLVNHHTPKDNKKIAFRWTQKNHKIIEDKNDDVFQINNAKDGILSPNGKLDGQTDGQPNGQPNGKANGQRNGQSKRLRRQSTVEDECSRVSSS